MFNADFYPTPPEVISQLVYGVQVEGKSILEPSGGKGNIVDFLKDAGAKQVISCEKNKDLQKILQSKCKVIADDFLTVTSDMVSHIDCIIGNPPFSADESHILHAYNIAPAGATIVMLCNWQTYKNPYSKSREQLKAIIDQYGSCSNLGSCFDVAERETGVKVGLVRIKKAGSSDTEFEGFFMDDEPEELQGNSIMQYNFVRDLVNRYVAAVKLFDKQLEIGVQMNALTSSFFSSKMSFECTAEGAPVQRNEFKKDLQKSAWNWVFAKMNMQKHSTKALKEDINRFVEKQTEVPFTMRNIYKMIEIVIGTAGSRMDKAIIEVFDRLTEHYDENRYNVEGWKTNSHYLVNEKFIMPHGCSRGWSGEIEFRWGDRNVEIMDDFAKALCYITGTNYDTQISLYNRATKRCLIEIDGIILKDPAYSNMPETFEYAAARNKEQELIREGKKNVKVVMPLAWGEWQDWGFFEIKCFKKGTVHCRFKNQDVWAMFNQHVARIKGYPLFEGVKRKK